MISFVTTSRSSSLTIKRNSYIFFHSSYTTDLQPAVFSIFYPFIRLFSNKRIEYKAWRNKLEARFADTDKGYLIRLSDYSRLKINDREASNKARHYVFSHIMPIIIIRLYPTSNHINNCHSARKRQSIRIFDSLKIWFLYVVNFVAYN